jgi:Double zinc ribbon
MTEVLMPTRCGVSVSLNKPEAAALLGRWSLRANDFGPLTDMVMGSQQGRARALDEILSPARELYEDELIGRQIKVLAEADRVIEARIALFGTPSDVTRFYASKEQADFTAIRPAAEFDCELLFPYSLEELLQWTYTQAGFSAGAAMAIPQLRLNLTELSVLAGMLDAWKLSLCDSFVKRRAPDPFSHPFQPREVVEAVRQGKDSSDRRYLVTYLNELFQLMVRPEGESLLELSSIDEEDVQSCLERFDLEGLLGVEEESSQTFFTPTFVAMASSFFSWISALSFHDIQVVEAGSGSYSTQEDLFVIWSTPLTVWVLATQGLSSGEPNLALTSYDHARTLKALDAFLQPVERRDIDDSFYHRDAQEVQTTHPCVSCRQPLPVDSKFCPHCGESVTQGSSTCCSQCEAEIAPSQKFCKMCGTPVAQGTFNRCSKCEAELAPSQKFCLRCGTRVERTP